MSRSQRVNFPTIATPGLPTLRASTHVINILSDNATTIQTRVLGRVAEPTFSDTQQYVQVGPCGQSIGSDSYERDAITRTILSRPCLV